MTDQPSPPPPPAAAIPSAQDRVEFARSVQAANDAKALQVQALREARQASTNAGGNTSVIKEPDGRIVVTGPNGKTITIDPKAGLNSDQIQEMVQTALQPTTPPMPNPDIPQGLIPIVAIVFPCLMLMVFAIARAIMRRPVAGGPATLPPETVARLARIEQAVEAVAIEVERISEAQRYSAQLLTDRLAAPSSTISAVAAGARVDHG